MKKRSGEENGSNMLQIELEKDGNNSAKYSLMKKSGLWFILRRERQGLRKKYSFFIENVSNAQTHTITYETPKRNRRFD